MESAAPATTATKRGPIAKQYEFDCTDRETYLIRARLCAQLTKPWVLPPLNMQSGGKLPQNYQSIGARGITTMVGKMLVALWPLDFPWFSLEPAQEIIADPKVSDDDKQDLKDELNLQKLLILSKFESSDVEDDVEYRGAMPFRSAERVGLDHLLITGDTLEYQTDEYTYKVFRRDQYVTRRDSTGNVLYHIVEEQIDPKTLSKKQQALAAMPEGWMDKPVADRMTPMWTRGEWDPTAERWVIDQEVNGTTINTSKEPVNPFHCTPYELSAGDHYGRGFVELNLGDLSSLDKLGERELDYAALASKLLTALDYGSEVREEDMAKPTGSTFRARVENGVVMDVAFLNVNKTSDMSMVFEKTDRLRKEMGAAMLIESEVARDKDRVTKFERVRLAQELDNALGGMYASISDYRQRPKLRRTIYQLRRDKLLKPTSKGTVQVRMLTGLAALARANQAQDLAGFISSVAQLGPDVIAKRINEGTLIRIMVRYANLNEPGLVKSDQEVEADLKKQIAAATLAAAGAKAVDSAGNIAEAAAANGMPPPPAPQPAAQPQPVAATPGR